MGNLICGTVLLMAGIIIHFFCINSFPKRDSFFHSSYGSVPVYIGLILISLFCFKPISVNWHSGIYLFFSIIAINYLIEQMERFCKSDSLHNKVLVFSNPYCGGCRYEFKERILPAMNEMDTSLWRFFFLIVVVDSTDTLKYNRLMLECQNMGIDTNNAYIWRLGRAKEDYNEVFLRFNSIHPLRNSIQGIPWVILLDKKNFISTQKLFYEDKRDSVWYEPRKFDSYSVHLDDFSIDDTSWFIMVSSNNKK